MHGKVVVIFFIVGMICFSECEKSVNDKTSIPEWYPSTIYGYTPYRVSFGSPEYPIPLNPGHTEFTQDEVVRYVGELIDQRQELIGADLESLRLVEVKNTSNNPQT